MCVYLLECVCAGKSRLSVDLCDCLRVCDLCKYSTMTHECINVVLGDDDDVRRQRIQQIDVYREICEKAWAESTRLFFTQYHHACLLRVYNCV